MHITKILLSISLATMLVSFNAFADRIAGSEFDAGTIIKLGDCENLATHKRVEVEIKISFLHVIKGNISPYTSLKKADSTAMTCADLKVGQNIVVGHAQGNDCYRVWLGTKHGGWSFMLNYKHPNYDKLTCVLKSENDK